MLICWCHKVAHNSFCPICEVFTTKSCERHLWIYFFFQKLLFESCDNRYFELRAGLMGAKGVINQKRKKKNEMKNASPPIFASSPRAVNPKVTFSLFETGFYASTQFTLQ